MATSFIRWCRAPVIWGVCLACCASSASENQLSQPEQAVGWRLLFDGKSTQGWSGFKQASGSAKGWDVKDGWLHYGGKGGSDVVSEAQYETFELAWEWKLAAGGNSGVKYFVTEERDSALGHEYQMLEDQRDAQGKVIPGKHATASFYDVLPPTISPPVKPAGEINSSRILVQGNRVEHWLNGVLVLAYELSRPAVQAAVAESKFKTTPRFGERLKGHILLQCHGSEVWFRNLKIRDLDKSSAAR